ncbi:hypothetical protein GCM10010415_09360 [Streptomyces atrovirens]
MMNREYGAAVARRRTEWTVRSGSDPPAVTRRSAPAQPQGRRDATGEHRDDGGTGRGSARRPGRGDGDKGAALSRAGRAGLCFSSFGNTTSEHERYVPGVLLFSRTAYSTWRPVRSDGRVTRNRWAPSAGAGS